MKNFSTSTNAEKAVQSADLVIEAITENMKVKKELFAKLDKAAPKYAKHYMLISASFNTICASILIFLVLLYYVSIFAEIPYLRAIHHRCQ
jgi:hypothetical protein